MSFLIGKVEMSWEEFRSLPRVLGWKYEYFGGAGYIEPRGCPVGAVLELLDGGLGESRTSPAEGIEQLEPLFAESFAGTVEYAGFSAEKMVERARRSLASHLEGRRGEPRPESRLFLRDGEPVGAALIVQKSHGPHLDMIMVHPRERRTGVARSLLDGVIAELLENGEKHLTSAYHLSNEPSRRWHRRMGFKEIPDHYAEQMKFNHRSWGNFNSKPVRPSKEMRWLNEMERSYGEEARDTLNALLRPGRRGRLKCPEWLTYILESPQRLP